MEENQRKMLKKVKIILLNNILINNILIIVKKDFLIKKWQNNWAKIEYNSDKAEEENHMGCSQNPKIQKLVKETNNTIKKSIKKYFYDSKTVLDLGCGTGAYLINFSEQASLTGIDLNESFLIEAKRKIPSLKTIYGNFLKVNLENKYDLIVAIGVLMYIEPSSIANFFKKLSTSLNSGGKIFFQYSHALSLKDIYYHDLSYVRYSPAYLEKVMEPFFSVLEHKHFFDNRTVNKFDTIKYFFPNNKKNRTDTIQNTYLLIAQKK